MTINAALVTRDIGVFLSFTYRVMESNTSSPRQDG